MSDSSPEHLRRILRQPPRAAVHSVATSEEPTYDKRRLTYANTFDSAMQSYVIRAVEWMTGKIRIIRMVRQFQRTGPHTVRGFWSDALRIMQIDLLTPQEQLDRIPAEGPVIIVANHPHGLVDGMIIADLLSKKRLDFGVLTRSNLTGIDEIASQFLIPVPFPHQEDAQERGLEMRAAAMKKLADGGVIALFPSGVVASSDTMMGPAIEREWNVFTAKMIRRSGATVVPIFFPGSNSRWYQIANRISATLRQGLLLHEIVVSCKKPMKPVIGKPLTAQDMAERLKDPRSFMTWLRDKTLSLKDNPDA